MFPFYFANHCLLFKTLCFCILQKVLEEIVNADSGAPCSPRHSKKKAFIDNVKRALGPHGNSKQLTEAAAVTCVKLCKASTYINILDSNNVAFTLVQSIINDLKVWFPWPLHSFLCSLHIFGVFFDMTPHVLTLFQSSPSIFFFQNLLFNPNKLFTRGASFIVQDIDLMIDCFVSCFRIKPHNNEALKVCINPGVSPNYHFVLISSLYR